MPSPAGDLDALVAEVLGSPKYRSISPDLVCAVGARELAARRSMREAVKETKGRLHQVAGAFLGALAASGTERAAVGQEWMSGDRLRSGIITVTGRIADPKDRGRMCFGLTHIVTTPAGRDAGTPLRTCRTAGNWTLEE